MPIIDKTAAVILAAGSGSRMGEKGKLLLPWQGKPLIRHALDLVDSLPFPTKICVLGKRGAELELYLKKNHKSFDSWEIIHNEGWSKGQSSSLKKALTFILNKEAYSHIDALLFFLADQPLIKKDTISSLLNNYEEKIKSGKDILVAAPEYKGKRGHPVLMSSKLFPDILALEGDTGARDILRKIPEKVLQMDSLDPGVVVDIDTKKDYEDLLKKGL